ncbi:hypothetical protein RRF57_000469 [Xylaria bambusicola]|uniref:Uncharacterized protein n=1 Tax=Xylaria bambusicola TaxID=326684 RepID=A0AAN7UAR8_9PEZI
MTEEDSDVVRVEAHPLRDETVTHIKATAIVMCLMGVVGHEKTSGAGGPRPVQHLQIHAILAHDHQARPTNAIGAIALVLRVYPDIGLGTNPLVTGSEIARLTEKGFLEAVAITVEITHPLPTVILVRKIVLNHTHPFAKDADIPTRPVVQGLQHAEIVAV